MRLPIRPFFIFSRDAENTLRFVLKTKWESYFEKKCYKFGHFGGSLSW